MTTSGTKTRSGDGPARGALLTVDEARLARWMTVSADLANPPFVRIAAATHLALATGTSSPTVAGCDPGAAALATVLGICRGGTGGSAPAVRGPSSGAGADAPEVLRRTLDGQPLGRARLDGWIAAVTGGSVSRDVVAIWLALLAHRRLVGDDLLHLTQAMASSGQTFDYRAPEVHTVRRYPTGGLSEKLALVLPTLLREAARTWPVRSAFLVGRSLAHTGGTWDKLSSVPGFRFPLPGAETRLAMKRVAVAMIVPNASFCPADRILYSLRSLTDAVESTDLIVSSIASKFRAAPVDHTVLDVRFGPHSFLPDRALASAHALMICELASVAGAEVTPVLTGDGRPDGSAVGNALEVAESLAVMGLCSAEGWDEERLEHQRRLASSMLSAMLGRQLPGVPWDRWAMEHMRSPTSLTASYSDLLEAHGVSVDTVDGLLRQPLDALRVPAPFPLRAPRTGVVRAVDYRSIGRVVNQWLAGQALSAAAAPGHDGSATPRDLTSGVRLRMKVGDRVQSGDPIMDVHARCPINEDTTRQLLASHTIEETI